MSFTERHGQILFLAILLLALLVRLPGLGDSFYGDENFSLMRDSSQLITDTEDRFRPVFFSLLYLWRQLGFHGEIGLRLLPLIFGLLQVPLAFAIGRRLRDRNFGLGFALVIALSPMLIEFSQELRMYSMVACIALLQVWTYLRLLDHRSFALWTVFVLTALVGVYTHLFYWFFLAGIALTFLRARRSIPLWHSAIAMGLTLLLYLPNIANLTAFTARRGGGYAMDLASALPKVIAAFTVGFNYFWLPELGGSRAIGFRDLIANGPLTILALAAGILNLWGILRLHLRDRGAQSLWLAHELFVIPILLALIASILTDKYFLQPKYLIFSTPFALMLINDGYRQIPGSLLRRATGALGLIIAVIALMHFWNTDDYGRRENWREACRTLRTEMNDRSALVVISGPYRLIEYYAPELHARRIDLHPPASRAPDPLFTSALRDTLLGNHDVFYVRWDITQNTYDPHDHVLTSLSRIGTEHTVTRLNPRLQIHHWELEGTP